MPQGVEYDLLGETLYENLIVVLAYDAVYEWYLNTLQAEMQKTRSQVGAVGVEYLFMITLGYDMSEQCNLLCVKTLAYVFYDDKIVVVHTSVTAYYAACELQAREYQLDDFFVRRQC